MDLQLPMQSQSVTITTNVVSSNQTLDEVNRIGGVMVSVLTSSAASWVRSPVGSNQRL